LQGSRNHTQCLSVITGNFVWADTFSFSHSHSLTEKDNAHINNRGVKNEDAEL